MIDEGYTKFAVDWTHSEPLNFEEIEQLIAWREPLYAAGLIGQYEELGIGFGNISMRLGDSSEFIISGTQTGHLPALGNEHFALVTSYDLATNSVCCSGPVQASSEAMTHAAIYDLDASIHAVVHIHSEEMWVGLRSKLPCTDPAAAYGTPEMAHEFRRLYDQGDFREVGVAIMTGHDEGIVSIGRSLEEATQRIMELRQEQY